MWGFRAFGVLGLGEIQAQGSYLGFWEGCLHCGGFRVRGLGVQGFRFRGIFGVSGLFGLGFWCCFYGEGVPCSAVPQAQDHPKA